VVEEEGAKEEEENKPSEEEFQPLKPKIHAPKKLQLDLPLIPYISPSFSKATKNAVEAGHAKEFLITEV
jgi:hypothetical protein